MAATIRGKARALAGGGRYDNLVKKMGGPDLPAVGFAMGDVTLADLLDEVKLSPTLIEAADYYLIAEGDQARSRTGYSCVCRSLRRQH